MTQTTRMAEDINPESPRALAEPKSVTVRSRQVKALSYLVLSLFSVFYIWPLFMLVNTALKSFTDYLRDPAGLPTDPSLANFGEAWELANFPQYMMNSAIYATSATVIFVLTSLFVAFPIARGYFRGSGAILTLYVVALFLPPALIPQFQLILNLGLYNTRPGFILLFLINPIGMIILVNYIKSIPKQLHYFPITRGLIVFEGVYGSNWPGIAAAVLMLMLPILILFMFLQRYIIGGLTAGAVKG